MNDAVSIVVVERQPMMLALLSATLCAEGMRVFAEVEDSATIMQIVKKLNPILILFSVQQTGLTDYERISALRREFPRVLIFALVSGDFRGQERMALDYGAHRALSKAAPRDKLVAALLDLSRQAKSGAQGIKKESIK